MIFKVRRPRPYELETVALTVKHVPILDGWRGGGIDETDSVTLRRTYTVTLERFVMHRADCLIIMAVSIVSLVLR